MPSQTQRQTSSFSAPGNCRNGDQYSSTRSRKIQPFFWRLNSKVTRKRSLGFQCGVGRIIESPALRDKRSCSGKTEYRSQYRKKGFCERSQNPSQTAGLPPTTQKRRFTCRHDREVTGLSSAWLHAHLNTSMRETVTED